MKQIEAPWGPDLWAENWERIAKDEAFCLRWCEYAGECPIVGNPYKAGCTLQEEKP